MKKTNIVLLLFLLGLLPVFGQELYLTETAVYQGDLLTTAIYPAHSGDTAVFYLYSESGELLTQTQGFFYGLGESGGSLVGLLAVDSAAESGIATVKVRLFTDGEEHYFTHYVKINEQDFVEMTISLSREVSAMVQSYDPRKREQSQRLWAALSEFNITHVYHDSILQLPVGDYEESAWFGDRRIFVYDDETTSHSVHRGLDLAADTGEPVLAPGSGRVVLAEERIVTGWTVIIEHLPGVYTIYYHLDSINVEVGEQVRQGEKIGEVGATGLVTGPHLHWELRINKVSVDPKAFINLPLLDKTRIINTIDD